MESSLKSKIQPRSSRNHYTNDSGISQEVLFFQNVDQLHGVFHSDSFRSRSAKSIDVVATRTFAAEDKGEEVD